MKVHVRTESITTPKGYRRLRRSERKWEEIQEGDLFPWRGEWLPVYFRCGYWCTHREAEDNITIIRRIE